jgi:hypothetical protein
MVKGKLRKEARYWVEIPYEGFMAKERWLIFKDRKPILVNEIRL